MDRSDGGVEWSEFQAIVARKDIRRLVDLLEPVTARSFDAFDAIAGIGDAQGADAILRFMFSETSASYHFSERRLGNLLGDYTTLVSRVVAGFNKEKTDGTYLTSTYKWYSRESDRAVKRLCRINTPVSTNILHLVLERTEFHSPTYEEEGAGYGEGVSLAKQHKMARRELKRRKSISYDPSLFLGENAWELPIFRRAFSWRLGL